VSRTEVAAGGRLRESVGTRTPTVVFAGLGIVLVAAGLALPETGFALPEVETLLFAWGGTALFLALLFQFVFTGPTVSAGVATDIYAAMARNARQRTRAGRHLYVPDGAGGVSLSVGDETFQPVGERLLGTVDTPDRDGPIEERLAVLVDVLTNELELVARARATTTEDGVTLTVAGSRVGTTELFDHPVASTVGVTVAAHRDTPVRVETSIEDETVVVTCRWSEGPDQFLEGANADEDGENDRADQ
jgi:hypothetical protein